MHAKKETTLDDLSEIMERGFKAVADDMSRIDTRIDDLRAEMIDQFDHVNTQFEKTRDQLREMSIEVAVIHRRVERLEELGASNAGFAKEIDHLLARVAAIEERLKTS
jgi:predicted  nucleic acid-binding Zn-ribbon protein